MSPVGSAGDARTFLNKAVQYLESASEDLDVGRYNPAVSSSVIAGINACDMICIAATGEYNTAAHAGVDALLLRSGPLGAAALPHIQTLMPQKNLSQYRSILNSHAEAEKAVAAAEQLVELAKQAAATLPG